MSGNDQRSEKGSGDNFKANYSDPEDVRAEINALQAELTRLRAVEKVLREGLDSVAHPAKWDEISDLIRGANEALEQADALAAQESV